MHLHSISLYILPESSKMCLVIFVHPPNTLSTKSICFEILVNIHSLPTQTSAVQRGLACATSY
jgi:hypothetical protein